MGTRADFYIGRGKDAEWIGSTAWDGTPSGMTDNSLYDPENGNVERREAEEGEMAYGMPTFFEVSTEEEFRHMVVAHIEKRNDGTKPSDGWPWPWEDSCTTDYSYAWDGDRLYISSFGRAWEDVGEYEASAEQYADPDQDDPEDRPKTAVFPNMKERQNVTFGARSGVIIVGR